MRTEELSPAKKKKHLGDFSAGLAGEQWLGCCTLAPLALLLRSCQGEGFVRELCWSDIHASEFALSS